ncbi:MAG: hypothetical protein AB7I27_05690 [Bacteriovoracaceae bacterium]
MLKKLTITLSLLITQFYAFAYEEQSDLFNMSPSDTGCFVSADYRCEDPMVNKKPFYPLISWEQKSFKARFKLLSSKTNSHDVQNSLSSCILYAQLLKTECGIQNPVAIYFKKNTHDSAVTFIVSDENVNLSKNSKLPQIFIDYFSNKLDKEQFIKLKVNQATNGVSLNSQGVFRSTESSFFELGNKSVKTICKSINGRNQCEDQIQTDEEFNATLKEGIFQISSPKLGPTYRIDVSSFNNTRLEFLTNWPFIQIVGDEGIAWAASNKFKKFELKSGQRLHLTSDIVFRDIFLMMQDDGNLVLRVLSTGKILWQTGANKWCQEKFNSCSDLSYYQATYSNGRLDVVYLNKSGGKKTLWHNGISSGDRIEITSTYPYIAIYGQNNNMLWPKANWLSCLGKSSGNVTCLHPEMPLYSQGDKSLLTFVNQKEGTKYSIEQGWCAPTSLAMAGKTFANEKMKHFDLEKNITASITNSFIDSNDPNTIIWNFMKQLNMDIVNQQVKFSWGYTYKGFGIPFSYAALEESLEGKKIFPMVPANNAGFANNYDIVISIPYAFSVSYRAENLEHSFGINKSQAIREKLFLDKMPMGVLSSRNHMFAMNGLESSRYLKLFDPWGGIYDVDVSEGKNGFVYAQTSGEIGNNQLVSSSNSSSATYFTYSLAGYVPIKHESNFEANAAASTYYSTAKDVTPPGNQISNNNGVIEISSDVTIKEDEAMRLADLVKNNPKQSGVVTPFAVSKPVPRTVPVQPATAVAPITELPPGVVIKNQGGNKCLIRSNQNGDQVSLESCSSQSTEWYEEKWFYNSKEYKLFATKLNRKCLFKNNNSTSLKTCSINDLLQFFDKQSVDSKTFRLIKQSLCLSANQNKLEFQTCTTSSSQIWSLISANEMPPIIRTQPEYIETRLGNSITLSVLADGKDLTYQWYKNDQKFGSASKDKDSISFIRKINDEGTYKVKVSNPYGEVLSKEVVIKNLEVVEFNRGTSNYKAIGEKVVLEIKASGTTNIKYEWYLNDKLMSEVKSSKYEFTFSKDKIGTYKVIVSNHLDESVIVSLWLGENISIATHPTSVSKKNNESVSLNVVANGSGTLSYQWYKGNSIINGATGASYTFNMTSDKAGDYKVKVTNSAGEVFSNVATVTLIAPPSISSHPASVSKKNNESVSLSVVATGSGTLSYQWYKGNSTISGATGASYTFNMASDKAGDYKVKVTNTTGEVFSNVATVTLISPPSVSSHPASVSKKNNESVSLSVVATGSGTLSYQWYKGNSTISGATGASYTFTMASDKAGDYKVKVTNSAGEVFSNVATVTLISPPSVIYYPASVSKKNNESVSLSVVATGSGTLSYQWYKGNSTISGATGASYTFNMTSDKAGDYKVKVTNSAGEVFSNVATVTLISPPSVSSHPASVSKKNNESVSLSVVATGSGTLSYQWYKGNSTISGATGASYTFNMTSDKAGDYKVKVTNSAGEVFSNVATVTLLPETIITQQPEHKAAKLNEWVVLSVKATGWGALSYQWYKDNKPIPGATLSSYSFGFKDEYIGDYKVIITDSVKSSLTSNVANVNYFALPVINSHPVGSTITSVGSASVYLSVTATGPGVLMYQWYKDDKEIAGATSRSYSFSADDMTAGKYKVLISNASGSVESNSADIIFSAPPQIISHPVDQTNRAPNDSVTLSVFANGARLKYQWYKDNKAIPGATSSKYNFTANKTTTGDYYVVVSNEFKSLNSKVATVTLLPETIITQQPEDKAAKLNEWVVLSVKATGWGALSYQWYKDNKPIPGATLSSYSFGASNNYFGLYKVVITNSTKMSITSEEVTVNLASSKK